ncbi:MAG: cyclic nucleotide-binding domain-containing protein [Candidatus Gracilibacteria bacterium]|nr:cyclic nucleotide-binding domain-containing protein [Candidatus Gracilibacteria bacterium]
MKEQIKDINQTPENQSGKKEKQKDNIQDMNNLKKEVIKGNSLLNNIKVFENSPLFDDVSIKKGTLLFDEGTIDNNLYIVKKGILSVEKWTTNKKVDTKKLAILKTGDFLGEGGLNNPQVAKEVLVIAQKDSQLLKIEAKNDLKKFIEENPTVGFDLLKHIITETNKRLLEANRIITVNYEINKHIKDLPEVNIKSILGLINDIKSIADINYVIYIEKHPVIDIYILKYDSRIPNKILDIIIEKKGNLFDLDDLYEKANISNDDYIEINKLNIGSDIYGYLIFGREKRGFDGSDKKVFTSICNSFVGVLKKFFTDKDDMNKLYISEMKK